MIYGVIAPNIQLPGCVLREGDPLTHLGPPYELGIYLGSAGFETRCGLQGPDGIWYPAKSDKYCQLCLSHGGVPHEVRNG